MVQNFFLNVYKMVYFVVLVKDIYLFCDIQELLGNLYFKLFELNKVVYWFNGVLKFVVEMMYVIDMVRYGLIW